jgi:hypothetical protein
MTRSSAARGKRAPPRLASTLCGSTPAELRFGAPIDVAASYTADTLVVIAFSAMLLADLDPCEASWGVGDVAIYHR